MTDISFNTTNLLMKSQNICMFFGHVCHHHQNYHHNYYFKHQSSSVLDSVTHNFVKATMQLWNESRSNIRQYQPNIRQSQPDTTGSQPKFRQSQPDIMQSCSNIRLSRPNQVKIEVIQAKY